MSTCEKCEQLKAERDKWKKSFVHVSSSDIQEIADRAEKAEAERDRLREAIRTARNHQTEMGGSFTQWFEEVQAILGEALNK